MNKSKIASAFVKYFLDTKPYHTKILEVIEQYNFFESINVRAFESNLTDVTFKNVPLCFPYGYGIKYDAECGFSSDGCCNLYECEGGFGVYYDNSWLYADYPISDITDNIIKIDGNLLNDTFIQIVGYTESGGIMVAGDKRTILSRHETFEISPYKTFEINGASATAFQISGDYRNIFTVNKKFAIVGSRYNDNLYVVSGVEFSAGSNTTTISFAQNRTPSVVEPSDLSGSIIVKISSFNNGHKRKYTTTFNSGVTTITIDPTEASNINHELGEFGHGSIVLRTGFFKDRTVWMFNTVSGSYVAAKPILVTFDKLLNQTVITIPPIDMSVLPPSNSPDRLRLYGASFGGGFDGNLECSKPKPYHIRTRIYEKLSIIVESTCEPIYLTDELGNTITAEDGTPIVVGGCLIPDSCGTFSVSTPVTVGALTFITNVMPPSATFVVFSITNIISTPLGTPPILIPTPGILTFPDIGTYELEITATYYDIPDGTVICQTVNVITIDASSGGGDGTSGGSLDFEYATLTTTVGASALMPSIISGSTASQTWEVYSIVEGTNEPTNVIFDTSTGAISFSATGTFELEITLIGESSTVTNILEFIVS